MIHFVGTYDPEWLSPVECRGRGSKVQLYRVRSPFSAVIPKLGTITVPRGFVTDMGSVPTFAQSYVGTETPTLNFPSLFHDFGYASKGFYDGYVPPQSRKEVDGLFRRMLLAVGMRFTQAWVIYNMVRLGGWRHWGSKS